MQSSRRFQDVVIIKSVFCNSILDSAELQEQVAVPKGFVKMMQMVVVIKGIDKKSDEE